MIKLTAKVKNLKNPIIVQVSFRKINLSLKDTLYIVKHNELTYGHSIYIALNNKNYSQKKPVIYFVKEDINFLEDGDILQIFPNGNIFVLWSKKQNPNDLTLFITNQCNANCIMCPQPPKKDTYSYTKVNETLLKYVYKYPIQKIGITGGEPTLKKNELLKLASLCYQLYPNAEIDLLTNAKNLADFDYVKQLVMSNPNIRYCISFPSEIERDFNEIMRANIYKEVIEAIQNLALLRQNIELRIVLLKQNILRLPSISEFIFRNFPFVSHIVFMGMEITGYALDNYQKINVNIKNNQSYLITAVKNLSRRNMNVSIYNIPYCLLDKYLWKFVRDSISNWKKIYTKECSLCIKKETCPGLFSTSYYNYEIKPIR